MREPPPGTGRFEQGLARIEAFADAVMAIAATLLVLTLATPPPQTSGRALVRALFGQWPTALAYVLSFMVIGRFWIAHHHLFRYVRRYDGRFLSLNLFFLLMLATLPFTTEVLGEHVGEVPVVVLYAGNVTLASVASAALWIYASHGHRLVDPSLPTAEIVHIRERSLAGAAVFGASIPLALVDPVLSYATWVVVFPLVRLAVAWRHRRRAVRDVGSASQR